MRVITSVPFLGLAVVSALDHVLRNTSEVESRPAWHGGSSLFEKLTMPAAELAVCRRMPAPAGQESAL
jgi:hypothetical protein